MDKFEILEAVGGIDEKYVRKADRLIAERAEIDRQVIKLTPEKRKFSWKTFAAAAASVAVLVTGTLIAVKFSGSEPIEPPEPPAEVVLTEEQQAYLDEWKTKISPEVDIAYAASRLHFTEIELPEDVTEKKFIDENRAVFIREETQTLEIYNIKEKTYTVAAQLDEKAAKNWNVVSADKDYVIFQGSYRKTGNRLDDGVYLYDVGADKVRRIYTEETEEQDIVNGGNAIITDGKVYFTVINNSFEAGYSTELHIYDIENDVELPCIKNASYPRYYNGEVFFSLYTDGEYRLSSVSGKYDLDDDTVVSKFGIYAFDNGSLSFKNLETDDYIFKRKYKGSQHLNSYDICDFALVFDVGYPRISVVSNNIFMYYAPTDEILVFQGGDGFREPTLFGWGGYITRTEPDGTVREFIFTDKESEDNVDIPIIDPKTEDPDPRKQYLNEVRWELGVSNNVDVAYARDRLNVLEFSFPWETAFAVDSGTLFIDSSHALVGDVQLMDKIEMYTLDTGEYTTLLSAETDPYADGSTRYQIYYTTADYIVFSRRNYDDNSSDLCLMELRKDGYPVIELGEDNSSGYLYQKEMFIDDNTLYYASNSSTAPAVYRYKIGFDEKPEIYINEGVPLCVYDDQLLYYTMADGALYVDIQGGVDNADPNERVLHSTSGEFKLEGMRYTEKIWACKYGVFEVDGSKLINRMTGETIISSGSDLPFFESMQPDFGVVIGNGIVGCIYNANTNELLVFEDGDDVNKIMSWRSCRWGLCRDGGMLISQFESAKPMNDHDISYADMGIPDVYVTTNEDVKHPLNIWLDIDPESISVVQSDDLPYGFTEYVESDKLKFTMNVALKETFYEYDYGSVWMEKHEFTIKRGEVVQLPMTMEDGGQFSITLLNDTEQANFGSTFHFALELNSSITCEIFYMEAYRGEREF